MTVQLPDAATQTVLSGYGEVYSYTVVTDAPEGFDEFAPYVLAIVKLDEGPMLTAQLTDLEGEPRRLADPSACSVMTGRSGRATAAPVASGIPMPMDPPVSDSQS